MDANRTRLFGKLTVNGTPSKGVSHVSRTLLESGTAQTQDVVKVLSQDALAAIQVLKRANNAYYGLQGQISSLTHAVEIVGSNSVLNLLSADYPDSPSNVTLDVIRQHALITAQISHRLTYGQWLWNQSSAAAGAVFTAGLVHQLGRLAIGLSFPSEARMIYRLADDYFPIEGPLRDIEQLQFGADFVEIGTFLASKLRLSKETQEVIQFHESPDQLDPFNSSFETILTVHVASEMATSMGYGLNPQGSILLSESTFGTRWYEEHHPGRILDVFTESFDHIVPASTFEHAEEKLKFALDRPSKPLDQFQRATDGYQTAIKE